MRAVHEVAEIRDAETVLLSQVPPNELMVRAATGLARTCAAVLASSRGGVYGARVCLLVGVGNNGGDAMFAGALLAARGASVVAIATGNRVHGAGRDLLTRSGGRIIAEDGDAGSVLRAADLVIDGILGIGGSGGIAGLAAECARLATESEAVVVAVDLPSGVDANTGVVAGESVWADVCVTFGALKPGLLLHPGVDRVGLLEVVDIGLHPSLCAPSMTVLEASDARRLQPHPLAADHKYSQGVVGVAAGSARYPGAAVLAVGAALLTKPGLVRYAGAAANEVVTAWPSAIASTEVPGEVGPVQAWAVGPGLGTDDDSLRVLTDVLAQQVPTVIDADALTVAAANPTLLKQRSSPAVLTPHDGEFARLAPDLDLTSDRISAARTLARRSACTVVLKGSTTVIADPDGQVRLNLTGTPWLATAGTGDVLTGMIAAYLAAGLTPMDAASLGAFIHGLAGRRAAGGVPCTSRDVVDAIPQTIRALNDE